MEDRSSAYLIPDVTLAQFPLSLAASALQTFAILGGTSEEEVAGLSDAATKGKEDYS